MSNLHILARSSIDSAQAAMHFPVPAGNNAAGFSWKSVFLAAGRSGTSALTEGTGPGQITTAEKATVTAGDTLELIERIEVSNSGSGAQRLAALDEIYTKRTTDQIARMQEEFRYYGLTR